MRRAAPLPENRLPHRRHGVGSDRLGPIHRNLRSHRQGSNLYAGHPSGRDFRVPFSPADAIRGSVGCRPRCTC